MKKDINWNVVKAKWKIAWFIIKMAVIIWLTETITFIIIYGWHWKAANDIESICDSIVWVILLIGFGLVSSVVINVVEYLLSDVNN